MTGKTTTAEQLINLGTRFAEASLKKAGESGNAATKKAILAVCDHLSLYTGRRGEIAKLVDLCRQAVGHGNTLDANNFAPKDMPKKAPVPVETIGSNSDTVLTTRQIEILNLFSRGLTYEEVAMHLNVSTKTIKNHASAIYERLGVRNKTEAVFEARSIGLPF